MNKEQIAIIRKLQAELVRINNGEKFFYNVTKYENIGLIKSTKIYYTDAYGNKQIKGWKQTLTEKAHRILNVQI